MLPIIISNKQAASVIIIYKESQRKTDHIVTCDEEAIYTGMWLARNDSTTLVEDAQISTASTSVSLFHSSAPEGRSGIVKQVR